MREEKPVDTNKTGDRHTETQIVLYVLGRTTDVSRTVPINESYTLYGSGRMTDVSGTVPIYESCTLHRAVFGWMAVILQSTS